MQHAGWPVPKRKKGTRPVPNANDENPKSLAPKSPRAAPDGFTRFMREESARMRKVIKVAGIRTQ